MKHVFTSVAIVLSCLVAVARPYLPLKQEVNVTGTYNGKAPCEDCTFIEVELDLNYGNDTSGEFSLREKFISKGGTDISSRMTGEWALEQDGEGAKRNTYVALNYDLSEKTIYYLVKTDGKLVPVDADKKETASMAEWALSRAK